MLIEFQTDKLTDQDREILRFIGSLGTSTLPQQPRSTQDDSPPKSKPALKATAPKTIKAATKTTKAATKTTKKAEPVSEDMFKSIKKIMVAKVPTDRDVIKQKMTELGAANLTQMSEDDYPTFKEFLEQL